MLEIGIVKLLGFFVWIVMEIVIIKKFNNIGNKIVKIMDFKVN